MVGEDKVMSIITMYDSDKKKTFPVRTTAIMNLTHILDSVYDTVEEIIDYCKKLGECMPTHTGVKFNIVEKFGKDYIFVILESRLDSKTFQSQNDWRDSITLCLDMFDAANTFKGGPLSVNAKVKLESTLGVRYVSHVQNIPYKEYAETRKKVIKSLLNKIKGGNN